MSTPLENMLLKKYTVRKLGRGLFSNGVKMKRKQNLEVTGHKAEAKSGIIKKIACPLLSVSCLLIFTVHSFAAEISSVNVRQSDNNIYVTASVTPGSKFIEDINNGITKELVFYIDLFRVWNIWPDEFVTGRKVVKILKNNPIKREHTASSIDGYVHIEKRFRDLTSMVDWSTNIIDMQLINIRELEPGEYFIKFGVESKTRKLPPVIGYLLFFVPEKEFSVSRDSQKFQINRK